MVPCWDKGQGAEKKWQPGQRTLAGGNILPGFPFFQVEACGNFLAFDEACQEGEWVKVPELWEAKLDRLHVPDCFVVGVEVSLASWANGSLNIGMGKVEGVMNGRNMQAEGLCGLELRRTVWTLAGSGGGGGDSSMPRVLKA